MAGSNGGMRRKAPGFGTRLEVVEWVDGIKSTTVRAYRRASWCKRERPLMSARISSADTTGDAVVAASGLKIHLMVTSDGKPVECFLTHGGFGDVDALKYYVYELPDGSIIYADKAYNDYEIEDLLKEVDHIELRPMRKKNSKRPFPPYVCFMQNYYRKIVETAGSLIEQLLPKSIHAVTSQGFELKVALFVIAYSLDCYLKL